MHRSSHDYTHLIGRWRVLASSLGLRLSLIAKVDGYPIYCVKSARLRSAPGVYLSAGIHGDEPASTEGLLAWAEGNPVCLREMPFLIFPCLNPWGLVRNKRSDASGNDVNRTFQGDEHPTSAAVRRVAEAHRLAAAMLLHEDYDAHGIYLYEQRQPSLFGELILQAAETFIPRDTRTRVDGRKAREGILRPRLSAKLFEKGGCPEAVWLHLRGCRRTVTFETPSEMSLEARTLAQVAAIERLVDLQRQGADEG
ncbi:MAG: Succinylglutamate desuccinylase / Aspartoacylase family protein [Verrucomicrobia bacterium]|nr:MAG: Succinylglutamate desuccinylase / Aspartoacylase family protein [Verrucomicrobiota bacterium]